MRKKSNKYISLVLSVLMITTMFSSLTMTAFADDPYSRPDGNGKTDFSLNATITFADGEVIPQKDGVYTIPFSNEPREILYTLSLNQEAFICSYGVVHFTYPTGVTVKSITNDNFVIPPADYNLDVGSFLHITDTTDNEYFQQMAKEVFVIPAGFESGDYVFGPEDFVFSNFTDNVNIERYFYPHHTTLRIECDPDQPCDPGNVTPVPAKAATCTEEGNIAYWQCDICGRIYSDAECTEEITEADGTVIPVIPHNYELQSDTATCTASGEKTWKCSVCGDIKTEYSPRLAHVDDDDDGICDIGGEPMATDTLELVLDRINSTAAEGVDREGDFVFVKAGDKVIVKAVITSGQKDVSGGGNFIKLEALESKLKAAGLDVKLLSIASSLQYVDAENSLEKPYGGSVSLFTNEPKEIAKFEISIPSNAADDAVYNLGFEEGAYYAYNNNSQDIELTEIGFDLKVANMYTVTFDDSAVTGVTQTDSYRYNTVVTAPAITAPEAKTFKGWDLVPGDGTVDIVDNGTATANANKTYIGLWEDVVQPYKFLKYDSGNYNDNQKSGNVVAGGSIDEVTYAGDTPAGKSFDHWATTEDGDAVTFPYVMPVGGVNFYPVFSFNDYTFSFEENGGSAIADITVTYSDTVKPADYTPVKAGFEFSGWYTDSSLNTLADPSYTNFTANMTVYAKWTEEEYNIKFYEGADTTSPKFADKTAKYDTPLGGDFPDNTPTKAGFEFKNWVDEDGNPVDENTKFTGDTNVFSVYDTPYGGLKYEDYWYAPTSYVMLRIPALKSATDGYMYDGHPMYVSNDPNYFSDAEKGAEDDADCAYVWLVKRSEINSIFSKLTFGTGTFEEIAYDADVNGNGKPNYVDANAIYQMLNNTGDYYGIALNADGSKMDPSELSILDRLEADVYTGLRNATNRSSIQDVEKAYSIYKK